MTTEYKNPFVTIKELREENDLLNAALRDRDTQVEDMRDQLLALAHSNGEQARERTEERKGFTRAIQFAIEQGIEAANFLNDWLHGDTDGWDYK
jgi:dsDNA-specific endonuclease/ATPase MutS2